MVIPRIIHQTCANKDELHPAIVKAIFQLRQNHPRWKYKLYDDADVEEFISNRFGPPMLATYQKINPAYGAARADFFRYLVIYDEGGVYLDIKAGTTAPLDHIVRQDDEYILSHWNNGAGERFSGWGLWPELGPEGEFQNWFIIARAGHPFLQSVISRVITNIENYRFLTVGGGKRGVIRTTGPIAYTLAIKPMLAQNAHRIIDSERLGLIYSAVRSPDNLRRHERIFSSHYSVACSPVVLPRRSKLSLSSQAQARGTLSNGTLEGDQEVPYRLSTTEDIKFITISNDVFIAKSIELYGEWCWGELELIGHFIKKTSNVIEVGSNIGSHTVFLAKYGLPEGKLYAFEPRRIIFQTLCANLALNAINNVYAFCYALGAERDLVLEGRIPSTLSNLGGFSLGQIEGQDERIPVLPLDDMINELPKIDLLKADCECHELQVLQGAAKLISRDRPIMYVENDRRERSEELICHIKNLDYNLYWHPCPLFRANNRANSSVNIFGDWHSYNLICVPIERNILIEGLRDASDLKFHPRDSIEKR